MELERLVETARGGDVKAFVELTRRFQQFAFGSALALVGDFGRAQDVVQEAFLAAWSALPTLADPAAFPGWFRGIVRLQAFRSLRRRALYTVPLHAAETLPATAPTPERDLEDRQQKAMALAAVAHLSPRLREPATLFYLHDCSQQDIATFLGLSVATVNNRLHAARTQLKRRMLAMMKTTLEAHALPDEFAHRIGRLIATRGSLIEARFDPAALPDLLSELAASDEANKRAVTIQVIQRRGGGVVLGVATTPIEALPPGSALLDSSRHADAAMTPEMLAHIVPLLTRPATNAAPRLLETGIKIIDVLCPLAAGGTVAIAGELGAGTTVVMEELVRRLGNGGDPLSLFTLMPPWPAEREPGFSHAGALQKEGYSEGTVGAIQTFFLRAAEGPWTQEALAMLGPIDAVIHLSVAQAKARIYPAVAPLTSRSRWLDTPSVEPAHAAIARRVREALASLDQPAADTPDPVLAQRARKLCVFFGQPFFVAEPYTNLPGAHVSRADALEACGDILDGRADDLPLDAFVFTGSIADIRARAAAGLPPAPPPWQAA
jgi:RNA polymerase sigma factor (sigma-70 family)